jgi:hypothetical protein
MPTTFATKAEWHVLYKRSRCHPTRGLRVQALVRDQYRCAMCGRTEAGHRLVAHHVVPPEVMKNCSLISTICRLYANHATTVKHVRSNGSATASRSMSLDCRAIRGILSTTEIRLGNKQPGGE